MNAVAIKEKIDILAKSTNVFIIKFFPNGIFTSVGKYSNSDVELTVEFPPIYLGQPF